MKFISVYQLALTPHLKTAIALLFTLVFFTGCGGGGSSKPSTTSPTPPTPTIPELFVTLADSELTIAEHNSITFEVSISGAQGSLDVETTLSGDIDAVTVSNSIDLTGGTVTLNVDELFNEGVISLSISFTDGAGRNRVETRSFELTNTSAIQSIADYVMAMSALEVYSKLTVESILYERVSQIAELANRDFVASTLALIDLLDQDESDKLIALINERDKVVDDYKNGDVDENIFQTKINEAVAATNILVNPVNTALQEVIEATLGVVPPIEFKGVVIDFEMGFASQFIGNTNLGAYEDNLWTFSPSYTFLSGIAFADELTCNAE
jgi:hypothetical protein